MSLPRSLFDTKGLPPRQAFAAWRDSIDVVFDVRLRSDLDSGFGARVDAYMFGDVFVGTARGAAQNFDRPRTKIGRDLADYYMLQFYLEGTCGARDGGADQRTRPGDLFIVDAAQSLATATSSFGNVNLIVPRRFLAPLLKLPDDQQMRILRGGVPLVALFRDHLCALYRQAGALRMEQVHSLLRPTLDLAASALNDGVPEHAAGSVNVALFAAIRRYIEANLGDPTLSADTVAAAFGISRRKLYYLFEPAGGFVACVQEERLRRCHAALLDPATRGRTIAEIASAHGFTNPVSFSRAFRRYTGMTAREARALAVQGLQMQGRPKGGGDWSQWIAQMR